MSRSRTVVDGGSNLSTRPAFPDGDEKDRPLPAIKCSFESVGTVYNLYNACPNQSRLYRQDYISTVEVRSQQK